MIHNTSRQQRGSPSLARHRPVRCQPLPLLGTPHFPQEKREHTTLGRNDAALAQGIMEKLEVGFLEQAFGGALGIGRIGDDDVEAVLVVVEELEAVADVDLGLGVLEALGHVGQVLLGQANDSLERTHVSGRLALCFRGVTGSIVPRQCRTG